MIIRAADLEQEGLEVDLPLVLDPLRSDADEAMPVHDAALTGRVLPGRGGLVLRGRLTCRVEVPCARCLALYTVDVDRRLELHYAASHPAGREIQIANEDLDCAFLEEGGVLDLAQVAAEQIYLELPMKPLCSASCRGLCSRCGENLNRGDCRCREPHSTS